MRKIKFRTWVDDPYWSKYKGMHNGGKRICDVTFITRDKTLVFPNSCSTLADILYHNRPKDIPLPIFKIMQYTGLKDKHNVEVYEGDIICEIGAKANGEKAEWRYEVCFGIYDNGEEYDDRTAGNGWYLKSIPRGYISEFMNNDGFMGKLQVIGNIYENKELLE